MGVIGFCLTAWFALYQNWTLPQFCWSIWLAGLIYAWSCVIAAVIQIVTTAGFNKKYYEEKFSFVRNLFPGIFSISLILFSILVGLIGLRIYSYVFGFYGLFLSVFAEMEPHTLFGRNGFINSDFFTPVTYLINIFWPMALGTLIASFKDFYKKDPWKRILLPFQKEVLRMHVMILLLPFIALIAWALFGNKYQPVVIILLLGIFYLLPWKEAKDEAAKKAQEVM